MSRNIGEIELPAYEMRDLPEHLRTKSFFKDLITRRDGHRLTYREWFWRNLPREIATSEDFVDEVLRTNFGLINDIPEDLLNKSWVLKAIQEKFMTMDNIPKKFKNDKDIVLALIRNSSHAYGSLDAALMVDPDIVKTQLEKHPKCFLDMSPLVVGEDHIRKVLGEDIGILDKLHSSTQDDWREDERLHAVILEFCSGDEKKLSNALSALNPRYAIENNLQKIGSKVASIAREVYDTEYKPALKV
jgi:hypothetical protein